MSHMSHRTQVLLIIPLLLVLFLGAAIGVAPLFFPQPVNAQGASSPLPMPFGGYVPWVTWCMCSGNLNVLVMRPGPPSPTQPLWLIFQPGASILFPYGQVFRPGPWELGTYITNSGAQCKIPTPVGCVEQPNNGMMLTVGTSI